MLQSPKMKCLLLSRYRHSDPHNKVPECPLRERHDLKQEITRGQGVGATTIRGANAFDVTLRFTQFFASKIDHGHKCALLKFHLTDDQNMRDLSTRDKRSKFRYEHSIHSQWKSKRMLATYMRRMRNNKLEIRIAGSSCRP